MNIKDEEELKKLRAEAWNAYITGMKQSITCSEEIFNKVMKYKDVVMKYGISVIGDPTGDGYPVYIALHGGGQGDTPDVNDQQWEHMGIYYKDSVENGIYINPRGIRDTWDTHANPESYIFYDRLIEYLIAFYPVDANRIYLMGFSAGGDGVYMIGPRMADRFAAVHMSAGHHNGTSILNLCNTPIQLQVGINDDAYGRNKVTVEYDEKLDELARKNEGCYIHNTYVHVRHGHNFRDNDPVNMQQVLADNKLWLKDETKVDEVTRDTNCIHFLNMFKRNPLPQHVVWDLGNRAEMRKPESFYWLSASYDMKSGLVTADYDTDKNEVTLNTRGVSGKIKILLNEEMLDLFKPITIRKDIDGIIQNEEIKVEPSMETLMKTTLERGDKNYQFPVCIEIAI